MYIHKKMKNEKLPIGPTSLYASPHSVVHTPTPHSVVHCRCRRCCCSRTCCCCCRHGLCACLLPLSAYAHLDLLAPVRVLQYLGGGGGGGGRKVSAGLLPVDCACELFCTPDCAHAPPLPFLLLSSPFTYACSCTRSRLPALIRVQPRLPALIHARPCPSKYTLRWCIRAHPCSSVIVPTRSRSLTLQAIAC